MLSSGAKLSKNAKTKSQLNTCESKLSYSKVVGKSIVDTDSNRKLVNKSDNLNERPSSSNDKTKAIRGSNKSTNKKPDVDDTTLDNHANRIVPSQSKIGSLLSVQYFDGGPADQTVKVILHCHQSIDRPCNDSSLANLVLITRVPVSMSFQELLMFIGPVSSNVKRMRLIRDGTPNQYLALLQFQDSQSSHEFYTHFHQVPFNSIEGDLCQLTFVDGVECASEHQSKKRCTNCEPNPTAKLLRLPLEDSLCPVCLEPTDRETLEAPITILCNHSFHLTCLLKWGDHSCPICRYVPAFEHDANSACAECGSAQDSLWLCITCGHMGCGRYSAGHAYQHYKQTSHNFVKLVGHSNKVWDYAADNYVHRLLQSNDDGKPVELAGQLDEVSEKIDAIQLEYTYLMTNQLDSQRTHYERQVEDLTQQLQQVKANVQQNEETSQQAQTRSAELVKENERLKKRVNTLEERLKASDGRLKEEQEVSKLLQEKLVWIQNAFKKLEDRNNELGQQLISLREELKDMQFFTEAQKILREQLTTSELEESQIIVTERPQANETHASSRHSNRSQRK